MFYVSTLTSAASSRSFSPLHVVVAFFATTSLCEVVVSVLEATIIFVSPVVTLSKLVILPRPAKSSKPKKGLILLLKGIQNSSHVLPSKSLAIFFVSGIVL